MYEQNILDQQAFAREATIASAVANPYLESGKVLIAETGLFYDVVTTNSTGAIALTNGKFLKHIENIKVNGNILKGEITVTASQVPQDSNNRFITDTERTNWNNKSNKTIQMIAGNGLTGGGTLEANRTFNVVSANDGIVVNTDNIQLNPVNALNSTSTTRPLTAAQGKALEDKKLNLSGGTMSGKLIVPRIELSNIEVKKHKTPYIDFTSSDTPSNDYNHRIISNGDTLQFLGLNGYNIFSFNGTNTATKFIGPLEGNANTATILQTARTLTVGNTSKTFNGSTNINWSLTEIGSSENKVWTSTIKRGTWSKICELKHLNLGNNLNLSINYTRGNVVCNDLIDISCGHSSNKLIKVFGGGYTKNRYRLTGGPNDFYFEMMDLGGDATGTVQSVRVSSNNINTNLIPITSFTTGLESDSSEGVLAINGLVVSDSLKSEKEVIAPNFIGKLTGNSDSTTKLQTARQINGTNFDGTGNITTANWGTARNIQIGNTTKSVNGSGNISWSLSEIGAVKTTTNTNIGTDTNESCIGYIQNSLMGQSDGALYSHVYSNTWKHQIQGDYRTGRIAVRGKNNNTWTNWGLVYDTNHKPSLTDLGIPLVKNVSLNWSWGTSVPTHIWGSQGDSTQSYVYNGSQLKTFVGLNAVNNWGASSSISANSTGEYATTNMVAQVRAEKLNKADRSNWNDKDIWGGVVGQLAWRQHNNGHTIFDASGSKTPTNVTKNNTDPDVAWSAGYPTLMGYNGSNTYGVRVDIARKAEILNTTRTIGGSNFNGSQNIEIPRLVGNSTGAINLNTSDRMTYGMLFRSAITASGSTGLFPTVNNANALLTINTHSGNYHHQLGFSSNNLLYHRGGNADGSWYHIYTSGNKPSKADIGLGSVNNWGASSSIGANSTGEYATTNMVAQVRAEKISKVESFDYDWTKNITMTAKTWTSTGCRSINTGTYIITIFSNSYSAGDGHYNETYSGILSWYNSGTNSEVVTEVPLTSSGHTTGNNFLCAGFKRVGGSTGNQEIVLASNVAVNNGSYRIKLKRIA